MTTYPEHPPVELPAAFRADLRALIHAQPTRELRSLVIYNIVRECYDAVRAIFGPEFETEERMSVGEVSDAAELHRDAMCRRPSPFDRGLDTFPITDPRDIGNGTSR